MSATLAAGTVPAFSAQWGAWAVVVLAAGAYAEATRRPAFAATARQALSFAGAVVAALVALSWPLADLAASHLLIALVVQRLLLMLAVAPLVLRALPASLVAAGTRPAAVDAVVRRLSRPVVAVVVVTGLATATLVEPAVQAQATSPFARAGFDAALFCAGVVLWLPVLHPVPGTARLSALGRAGYLVVQSIVPSFLCIVWIFARHPLYPAYAHAGTQWGLSAVADQQVAGFVAKLVTILVLWSVAFFIVLGSEHVADRGEDPDPLTWADVERELLRVERRERQVRRSQVRRPGLVGQVRLHRNRSAPGSVRRPAPGQSGPDAGSPRRAGSRFGLGVISSLRAPRPPWVPRVGPGSTSWGEPDAGPRSEPGAPPGMPRESEPGRGELRAGWALRPVPRRSRRRGRSQDGSPREPGDDPERGSG